MQTACLQLDEGVELPLVDELSPAGRACVSVLCVLLVVRDIDAKGGQTSEFEVLFVFELLLLLQSFAEGLATNILQISNDE